MVRGKIILVPHDETVIKEAGIIKRNADRLLQLVNHCWTCQIWKSGN
jgi:hypothetical protein